MRAAILLLAALPAMAQFSSTAAHIRWGASLPAHCRPSTGDVFFLTSGTIGMNYCSATDTWTAIGSGGGSPGGTSGQVQWNNGSGGFGADNGLAYNSGTKALGVIGPISSGQAGSTAGSITVLNSGTAEGSLAMTGHTSGTVTVKPQAVAGTPAILWPTTSGTVATTATTPVTLNATTGAVGCATCVVMTTPVAVDTAATASTIVERDAGAAILAATQSQADNSTKVATTAYVDTGLATKAATGAFPTAEWCVATGTSFTTPTQNQFNLISFNTNDANCTPAGIHNASTNTSRFIAPEAGYFEFGCNVPVDNASSVIALELRLNGAGSSSGGTLLNTTQQPNGTNNHMSVIFTYHLAVNDYVECFYYPQSATAPNTGVGGASFWFKRAF